MADVVPVSSVMSTLVEQDAMKEDVYHFICVAYEGR